MIKRIKELFSMFKGVKGIIVLKCDNCESIDLRMLDGSLKYKDIESEKYNLKNVQYDLKCNKCGTYASVGENWFVKKGMQR